MIAAGGSGGRPPAKTAVASPAPDPGSLPNGAAGPPVRPPMDVIGREVHITLGGQGFVLPVRSIKRNREWKAELDARTAAAVDALTRAGDDENWSQVLLRLSSDPDPFIDLLVSYAPNVLSRELIEDIEPDATMDVITACREVWLAATPLLATTVAIMETMTEPTPSAGSEPTSSPPKRGATAHRKTSRKH